MRIIKYKKTSDYKFVNYIDISACERDFYFINFYVKKSNNDSSLKPGYENYSDWYESFLHESFGSKLIIINFYLREFMNNDSEYFKDVYEIEIFDIIRQNLDFLKKVNKNWFYNDSSLFKGLDLNWEDVEDRIVGSKENEDGIRSEVEFDDGSVIQFIDENEKIESFYIKEVDAINLSKEIALIDGIFKPKI
jgi:hypothetical protein